MKLILRAGLATTAIVKLQVSLFQETASHYKVFEKHEIAHIFHCGIVGSPQVLQSLKTLNKKK